MRGPASQKTMLASPRIQKCGTAAAAAAAAAVWNNPFGVARYGGREPTFGSVRRPTSFGRVGRQSAAEHSALGSSEYSRPFSTSTQGSGSLIPPHSSRLHEELSVSTTSDVTMFCPFSLIPPHTACLHNAGTARRARLTMSWPSAVVA
jgi:hypothetical protein